MADQVINWLLLLRSGKATAQDYNDFLAWGEQQILFMRMPGSN